MKGCSSTDRETFSHYKPSPAHHHKRYHVFLSFEGVELRKSLVDHLFESLSTAGFQVFVDNEKEENIGVRLKEAVRDSTVYIPIFSADYASSACRLDELSLIWTCNSMCTGTTIIPLFYKVEPSDVRYPDQKGPYAKAFQKHSEEGRSEEKMDAWKKALHEISLLSGWSLAETAGGYEGRLVKLAVMDLLNTLKITSLDVAKHPEGLSDRMEEVRRLLEMNNQSRHVVFVGIWGMGGLGKTTLAKAIYNNIHSSSFQASCFVFDVRASTKEFVKGLLELQKQILRDVAKVDESTLNKLNSVSHAKIQMENLLRSIKAFVVLDDVDDEEQLHALVGDPLKGYWFGRGSRIIVTTRDSEVLTRQINMIQYHMRGLNRKEGLKLFCWHSFMRTAPAQGYEDITGKIVDACQGLPLSLEVVGAHLYGEKDLEFWREALNNLLNVKNKKVYSTLKISYDALSCEEQRMFLDIACFFLGPLYFPSTRYNMDFYVKLWRDLKCRSPRTYLRNLERKSLIIIDEDRGDSIFWMHDHLRDLGRQIIEEESPNNPANRSRLWCQEDIVTVTAQTQGISNVEGLVLNFSDHLTYCSTYSWASMLNLKFMFIRDLCQEGRTTLPPNLIYLGLWNCRFQEDGSASEAQPISFTLPKTIGQLKFLRFLDMSESRVAHLPNEVGELLNLEELYLSMCHLEELPQGLGNLIKLKVLDVSMNIYLEELPVLPSSLIELNLHSCKILQKMTSISHLKKLEVLDVSGCTSLKKLPSLDSMHSLKDLKLESCVELQELPALRDNFSCLSVSGCYKLQELSSISHLKKLEALDVSWCKSLTKLPSLDSMHSLKDLKLERCEELQELPALPDNISCLGLNGCYKLQEASSISLLKKLEVLDVVWCKSLTKLPSLDYMHSLKDLTLQRCEKLQELPALPDNFSCLSLRNCYKLQEVSSISHLKKLEVLDVSRCTNLTKLPSLDSMHSLKHLKLEGCVKLQELPDLPDNFCFLSLSGCYKLQEVSSISYLKKLEALDASGCKSLTKLPSLDSMHSLEYLKLESCVSLTKLPTLASMHSLKYLRLENCVELQELPALPDNISYLRLSGCYKLQEVSSISHLKKLEALDASGCKSLTKLPSLDSMHSLKYLKLESCVSLMKLPSLDSMHSLKCLNLESCVELQELPALPDNISYLRLSGCYKLQEVYNISHLKKLKGIHVSACKSLTKLPSLDSMHSLKNLKLDSCDLKELQSTKTPKLSHMIEQKTLDLSGCINLTTLPQLSSLLSLRERELTLDFCWNLEELPPLPKGINLRRKRKNREPGDITALSLVLPNPKRLHVSMYQRLTKNPDQPCLYPKGLHVSVVNAEGSSAAQEYMDQDGQGAASFPTPPAGNT